jgi:hypothetical protein
MAGDCQWGDSSVLRPLVSFIRTVLTMLLKKRRTDEPFVSCVCLCVANAKVYKVIHVLPTLYTTSLCTGIVLDY